MTLNYRITWHGYLDFEPGIQHYPQLQMQAAVTGIKAILSKHTVPNRWP
ncbi:MAG TPA: hypothetical protein VK957_22165 [Lunatimonas sp.]|nr:hypothetical protein [Lunatimonas sp.]